jgi:hypothetical protein
MMEKMMMDIPLRFLAMMGGDQMNPTKIDGLVDLLNGKYLSGIRKMRQKSG